MFSYPQAFEHAAASLCLNLPLSPLFAGLISILILDLSLLTTSLRKPLLDIPIVPCADSCINACTLYQNCRFSYLSLQLKSIFCSSYITSAEHSTWYVVGGEQIFTESVNLVTGMTADEVWKREFGIKLWRALDSMLRYLYFILQSVGSHWWFLRREWHNLNFLF